MAKSGELILNIFIAIVLIVGGIASTIVALYPRWSNEDLYDSGDVNVTQNPQPYVAVDSNYIIHPSLALSEQ